MNKSMRKAIGMVVLLHSTHATTADIGAAPKTAAQTAGMGVAPRRTATQQATVNPTFSQKAKAWYERNKSTIKKTACVAGVTVLAAGAAVGGYFAYKSQHPDTPEKTYRGALAGFVNNPKKELEPYYDTIVETLDTIENQLKKRGCGDIDFMEILADVCAKQKAAAALGNTEYDVQTAIKDVLFWQTGSDAMAAMVAQRILAPLYEWLWRLKDAGGKEEEALKKEWEDAAKGARTEMQERLGIKADSKDDIKGGGDQGTAVKLPGINQDFLAFVKPEQLVREVYEKVQTDLDIINARVMAALGLDRLDLLSAYAHATLALGSGIRRYDTVKGALEAAFGRVYGETTKPAGLPNTLAWYLTQGTIDVYNWFQNHASNAAADAVSALNAWETQKGLMRARFPEISVTVNWD